MTKYQKKNFLIGGLLAIVVVMGIAYAAFASNLTITGTSNVNSNWCIGFDSTKTNDLVPTPGITGGDTPTGSISFSGDTCAVNYQTNASLTAAFKQPGDKIVYTLTIGNKSTFTAAIKSIKVEDQNVTSNKTITKGNIKYTVEMPETTTLAVDAETTMKITAEFQNDTDIEKFTGTETQTLSVEINAQQDDGNGGMDITPVSNKYTGSIYRYNNITLKNGDSIENLMKMEIVEESVTKWCDIATSSGIQYDCFDTETECNKFLSDNNYTETDTCQQKIVPIGGIGDYTTDASTLNKTYYLKHDVVDDIITASYVCFVTDTEHCMKGGDNGDSFATNTQIIKDYQTYYPSQNTRCSFLSGNSGCGGGGFGNVHAYSSGYVYVYGSSSETCDVDTDGSSHCY